MSEANVGVVVYCKNDEDGVENAIYSVATQTPKVKSILIIDDASTDNTWATLCKIFGEADLDNVEFERTIDDIKYIVRQNEFEDKEFRAFREGVNLLKSANWIGFLAGNNNYLAGKTYALGQYEDENFAHIYTDFVYEKGGTPVRAYQTSHWTDHPDIGFFNRTFLDKIDLTKLENFEDLNKLIRANFLVGHIPEGLQYVRSTKEWS